MMDVGVFLHPNNSPGYFVPINSLIDIAGLMKIAAENSLDFFHVQISKMMQAKRGAHLLKL